MCYTIKDYLYVLIILALDNHNVFCWREDYLTQQNIVTSSNNEDYNPDIINSGEVPCDPIHISSSDEYFGDKNVPNYQDRVIFPDEVDDYTSNKWNTKSTTAPSPQELKTCLETCSMNTTYDPVCGTDNITYINLERLECRIKCGVDVRIRQLSACPEELETITKLSPIIQTEILKSCLLLCPTTQEYNPVCGTDNITYYNYGKMICARICGVDVQVKRHAPCPKQSQTTTEPTVTSNSLRPYELNKEFLMCLQICPTTSEYNPVCGSNDKTYYNIGRLQCARSCGSDVTVLKQSPCSIEISISLNINSDENKVLTTTTTTPRIVEDFTIPQDVLDSIFANHEDDETIDIDVRKKNS